MSQELQEQDDRAVSIPIVIEGIVSSLAESISQSGMLCWIPKQIDEMTLLDISFELPRYESNTLKTEWIKCRGVVVSCEQKEPEWEEMPYEVAIFFDRISERNRNLLLQYTAAADPNLQFFK